MTYGRIVNYLLASLVRSSPAKLGCVFLALVPSPIPGLPIRRDIPTQRNHAVACECNGYVRSEFIGDEGSTDYACGFR